MRWLTLLTLLLPAAHAGELTTAAAVLEFAAQKTTGYQTFSADLAQTTANLPPVTGTFAFKQPALTRMELAISATQRVVAVLGSDRVLWQETSGPVLKLDLTLIPANHPAAALLKNPFEVVDPHRIIQRIQTDSEQTLTGTTELHGQPMYILDGRRKQPAGRQRAWIGQRDGFLHKLEQYDPGDTNLLMTVEFTNVKFNPDLPDDLFRYRPAPGATVVDMNLILHQAPRRK